MASGEGLARRFHFSRFHFDRMISSAAGEPPQTFRRRIMLERAAYRLVTTSAPVIDVAVEAGYGSHEALHPRLHQGVRRTAGRLAPQARTPAGRGAQRRPLPPTRRPAAARTRRGHEHGTPDEDGRAPRVAHRRDGPARRRLTDDQLDRPIELDVDDDRQTIRSLLSRLVGQMGMWNAAMATRDYDWSVEEHESLASMRAAARRRGLDVPRPRPRRRRRQPARRHLVDALRRPAEVFTYGGMIAHVLTFAAHRRTLVASLSAATGSRISAGATRCCGWRSPA